MRHYNALTNRELCVEAECDPRFQFDPLFTELVLRVRNADPNAGRRSRSQNPDTLNLELIDARR